MNLHLIARALDGKSCGGQVLCPGPGHSRQDRSLAVMISKNDEVIVHSFAGDDWRKCQNYIQQKLGLRGPELASTRPNAASAARIWQESLDPHGTLAEKYLRGRALELPQGCSRFVRFHKSCPFGRERFPALISLIRNIETDKSQAIQRTACFIELGDYSLSLSSLDQFQKAAKTACECGAELRTLRKAR